jgi:hypothetical protein
MQTSLRNIELATLPRGEFISQKLHFPAFMIVAPFTTYLIEHLQLILKRLKLLLKLFFELRIAPAQDFFLILSVLAKCYVVF